MKKRIQMSSICDFIEAMAFSHRQLLPKNKESVLMFEIRTATSNTFCDFMIIAMELRHDAMYATAN